MTLIIDTHCWLWWLSEPDRLRGSSVDLLRRSDTTVMLSAASSWEIAIKHSLGKLSLPEAPAAFVATRMERERTEALAIQHAHALAVASLPPHHTDPFDRLLIAQAIVERVPIMTADRAFRAYAIDVIDG